MDKITRQNLMENTPVWEYQAYFRDIYEELKPDDKAIIDGMTVKQLEQFIEDNKNQIGNGCDSGITWDNVTVFEAIAQDGISDELAKFKLEHN